MNTFHSHGHCQLTTVVFTRLLEGDECRLLPHRRDDRLHGAEHQLLRGPRVRLLQGADRLLGETVLVLCTARSPSPRVPDMTRKEVGVGLTRSAMTILTRMSASDGRPSTSVLTTSLKPTCAQTRVSVAPACRVTTVCQGACAYQLRGVLHELHNCPKNGEKITKKRGKKGKKR